jgi:hypothetical protein
MATDPDAGNPLVDSEISVALATAEQAPHVQYAPEGLHLGGGGGGSYSFSPEDMQHVIDQWQDIVERANRQVRHIQIVTETTSAARTAPVPRSPRGYRRPEPIWRPGISR